MAGCFCSWACMGGVCVTFSSYLFFFFFFSLFLFFTLVDTLLYREMCMHRYFSYSQWRWPFQCNNFKDLCMWVQLYIWSIQSTIININFFWWAICMLTAISWMPLLASSPPSLFSDRLGSHWINFAAPPSIPYHPSSSFWYQSSYCTRGFRFLCTQATLQL